MDCLRADHCGFYGYSSADHALPRFSCKRIRCRVDGGSRGRADYFSIPAMLASRMPLALGRDVVGLAPENTLASALRDADYATGAFSAAEPLRFRAFWVSQGFDMFRDFLDFHSI